MTAPGSFLRCHGAAALDWAAGYLERVDSLPVLAPVSPGEIAAALPAACPEEPEGFDAVLADLDGVLLPGVTHWQHPRYFAYFPSCTSEPAILAELLAATLNSVSILWRTAPAATELEGVVARWVLGLLGLPEGWHGHIEDSASTGVLAAAIAAREATGRRVLVCSAETHSSTAKAARMLDLDLRVVPVDAGGRLEVGSLGSLDDVAMLVATVGTTSRGAVDEVPALAEACAAAGVWLHVDAAWAGTAMVCEEFRSLWAGVERADSLVVNAHKWMLTPMDCSLFFCARPDALRAAFSLTPEYLRAPGAEDSLALSEYGPALGRRFRALKLWAVLRCFGRSGLQAHVRSGVALARRFEAWVTGSEGWELCAERHFSLVCFRAAGSDELNRRLLAELNASGEAFLSHTVIDGRFVLRLAVGSAQTTEADVLRVCAALQHLRANSVPTV
jgi:aromatic-L-amino-acid decarboxylase